MAACLFCAFAQNGLPKHGLFADESLMVILDQESLGEGHCMIIPKRHVTTVYELHVSEYQHLFDIAQQVATCLQQITATKAIAYVSFGTGLPHAHLHLVPHNDSEVILNPRKFVRRLSEDELIQTADRLRPLLSIS